MVGHWTFDSADTTNNISDTSGNNNTGYLQLGSEGITSTTTSSGPVGQALVLDGTDDYINILDSATLDVSTSATWSFWGKRNVELNNAGLIDKNSTDLGNYSYYIKMASGADLRIQLSSDGTAFETDTSNLSIDCGFRDSDWTHIAVTFNSGSIIYYRNGIQCDTDTSAQTPINNSSENVWLGKSHASIPLYFNGSFDDIYMFSRALSASDISKLYNLGYTPYVISDPASLVDVSTATLNGNIITDNATASSTVRGFAYGTDSTLVTVIATTTENGTFGTGSFSSNISSLIGDTTYYLRAYAANATSTGYGSIQSFTTEPSLAVLPTVTVSATSNISTSTVTLNGSITATGGDDAVQSGFTYGTDITLQTVIATSTLGAQSGNATYSEGLSSLSPNTIYYFRSYATNSAGTGYSSILSFTTGVASSTITTNVISGIASTTATIHGTITATGGADATESGFAYSTDPNLSSGVSTTTLGGQSGTASFIQNISALATSTTYFVRAYSINSAGTGFGNIQSFTTNNQLNKTTYFISSSLGNDSNTGTSTDKPWQSLSKIYNKCSSANKFIAGDSIFLKAGDSFDGPLTITCGGSDGLPLTIGRYGNGEDPIIFGDHPSASWSSVVGHTGIYSSNLYCGTITDIYDSNGNFYTKIVRGTDTVDTWLDTFTTSSWGCDLSLNKVYLRTFDDGSPLTIHMFEWTVINNASSADYVIIQNLDIRKSNIGIAVSGATEVKTRNNSIQDTLNMGIYYGSSALNGEIAHNIVTRTGWTQVYLSTGGGHWVHHNTISYSINTILGFPIDYGGGNTENCGIGLERGVGNIIEYNSISNEIGSFIDYWLEVDSIVRFNYGFHGGGATYPDGTGLKLYNNIFNVDGGSGIGGGHDYDAVNSPAPDSGPNVIFNNIIYNFKSYGFYFGPGYDPQVIFRNNIIIATSTNVNLANLSNGADSDYNLYYVTGGAPRGWYWNNARYTTLSGFQATSSQENHSVYADPQFVSANPVTAADFQLKSTSLAINTGKNLVTAGILSENYLDYSGIAVPQGNAPDIGAYEYESDSIPEAPISISAVAGDGQATISFTAGSDGGSTILYYLASSTPGNFTISGSASPLTITGLTNGTSYTFQIYAVNAMGTSSPSAASNSVTPSVTIVASSNQLTSSSGSSSGSRVRWWPFSSNTPV